MAQSKNMIEGDQFSENAFYKGFHFIVLMPRWRKNEKSVEQQIIEYFQSRAVYGPYQVIICFHRPAEDTMICEEYYHLHVLVTNIYLAPSRICSRIPDQRPTRKRQCPSKSPPGQFLRKLVRRYNKNLTVQGRIIENPCALIKFFCHPDQVLLWYSPGVEIMVKQTCQRLLHEERLKNHSKFILDNIEIKNSEIIINEQLLGDDVKQIVIQTHDGLNKALLSSSPGAFIPL